MFELDTTHNINSDKDNLMLYRIGISLLHYKWDKIKGIDRMIKLPDYTQ